MKYLVDTHVLIWAMEDSPLLGVRSREIFQNSANDLVVSKVSVWEMAVKLGGGKLKLLVPLREYLGNCVAALGVQLLNLELNHIFRLQTLPLHHRDPFDRILIAQALVEEMPIMTGDSAFAAYPAALIN